MSELNADARMTVEAVRAHRWQCVRLRAGTKKPEAPRGGPWATTTVADEVADWFLSGANVGLVCSKSSGVAVLDPDNVGIWGDMIEALGQPCLPWVLTGSGKLHYYVAWVEDLPPKLTWNRTIIGEIQRGPGQQQVVMPGSVHPDTGVPYRWITERLGFLCEPINPVADPLPRLNGEWLAYLRAHVYR